MIKNLRVVSRAFAFVVFTLGAAQAGYDRMKKDVVDTAVSAGQFSTLVAVVKAAGLVEARSRSSRRPMRPSPSFRPAPSRAC